ncbi:methyltransferase domain-containing protein, partial [Saccharothrix sp. MB29]|nr:methyltransferase domain-containing protein [Saccharothrix sp. MB29]
EQARNWIAWVRRPGFDSYWRYRDAFFALVPAAGGATLDLGCGEGRVSRDLGGRGHRVTGVDASPTLLEAARQAVVLLRNDSFLPLRSGVDLAVIGTHADTVFEDWYSG